MNGKVEAALIRRDWLKMIRAFADAEDDPGEANAMFRNGFILIESIVDYASGDEWEFSECQRLMKNLFEMLKPTIDNDIADLRGAGIIQ